MLIHDIILNNYRKFDEFLTTIPSESFSYKALLSIRLNYSAVYGNAEKLSIIEFIKNIIKLLRTLIKPLITKASLSKNANVVVIGSDPLDVKTAELLSAVNAKIKFRKKLFFITAHDLRVLSIFMKCCFFAIKSSTLNRSIFLKSSEGLMDFLIVYRDIDLKDIEILIMESDSIPENTALVFKAKEQGIPTIKIDHFLIDPINHNQIFCQYYFYPSTLHLEIMKKFKDNKSLIYIEGGIIHWDCLDKYKHKKRLGKREITFFAQHGEIFDKKDEIFYIDEILSLMNNDDMLKIKLHPRDKSNKYNHYSDNPRVTIIKKCDDNYALIAESDICISICSTMTMEAKHICRDSYFINYEFETFDVFVDYKNFDGTIETIKNRSALKNLLENNKKTFGIKSFIKKFNFSYPQSANTLIKVIQGIKNEKKNS